MSAQRPVIAGCDHTDECIPTDAYNACFQCTRRNYSHLTMCEVPFCEQRGVLLEVFRTQPTYTASTDIVVCSDHMMGKHAAITQNMIDNGCTGRCNYCGFPSDGAMVEVDGKNAGAWYHYRCALAYNTRAEYTIVSEDHPTADERRGRTYIDLREARDHAIRMSGIGCLEYRILTRLYYHTSEWVLLEVWDRRTVFAGQAPTQWHYLHGPAIPEGWSTPIEQTPYVAQVPCSQCGMPVVSEGTTYVLCAPECEYLYDLQHSVEHYVGGRYVACTPAYHGVDVCFVCTLPANPDNSLIGTVNSDPLHLDCMSPDLRRLYTGRLTTIVRSTPYYTRSERYCDTGCGTVIPAGVVAYRTIYSWGDADTHCAVCNVDNLRKA